ncbi:uncharacterized protein LOC143586649 [Bidens hawaiensis]|uniref:uncharacterized protein LOC143586649 n=1 Tax=Bidens hawaiensis TaxID=980011 RepID=UPI00404AC758
MYGWNWTWSADPFTPIELQELWDCLEVLPGRVLEDRPDKWKWGLERDGRFTTKSCREQCAKNSHSHPIYVMDWNNWVPLKVNLFWWKAEMGRLATSDALFQRNAIDEIKWCPLCEDERESVDHIFLSCYVATII